MPGNTPDQELQLCIVVPCLNEQDGIQSFYDRLKGVLQHLQHEGVAHQIIFVDDGSDDNTLDVLKQIRRRDEAVTLLSFSRNFGHQIALTAGLDEASGDAVLLMDSDLQHPPELIPAMLEQFRAGNEIVSMVRQNTNGGSWFKRLTSDAFYYVLNLLSDTPIERGAADFVLLSKAAHRALLSMPERHRFLRGMVAWIGFRRAFIPYDAPPRKAGDSKYGLWRMIALAADAAFSFSVTPARLTTRAGLALAGAGGCYLLYVLFRFFWFADTVVGWSSLLSVMLLIGGFQLLFTGMLAEYVVRIFEESKQRPLYILRDIARDANTHDAVTAQRSQLDHEQPT